jgi:hemoglobin
MSIYYQIGGGMTVGAIIDRFNRRVLSDAELAPQYHGVEVHRLAAQQRAYLAAVLGGPQHYFGGQVSPKGAAHAGMDEPTLAHLAEALRAYEVPEAAIAQVVADLRATPGASRATGTVSPLLQPPPAPPTIRPELPNTAPVAGRFVAA